jgi:hypothetical protein
VRTRYICVTNCVENNDEHILGKTGKKTVHCLKKQNTLPAPARRASTGLDGFSVRLAFRASS